MHVILQVAVNGLQKHLIQYYTSTLHKNMHCMVTPVITLFTVCIFNYPHYSFHHFKANCMHTVLFFFVGSSLMQQCFSIVYLQHAMFSTSTLWTWNRSLGLRQLPRQLVRRCQPTLCPLPPPSTLKCPHRASHSPTVRESE